MPANNEVRNINLFGDVLSLKQDIFDSVHPIGETYTQYPQQDPPATVYNKNGITSEWELISYDGAFFRAEGTNANPFTEKGTALNVQGQTVQSHHHGMQHRHEFSHGHHMDHQHTVDWQHYHALTNASAYVSIQDALGDAYWVIYDERESTSYLSDGRHAGIGTTGDEHWGMAKINMRHSHQNTIGGKTNYQHNDGISTSTGGRIWTDYNCYHTNDNWATWWNDNYTNIAQIWKDNAYINKDNTDDTGSTETRPKNLTIRVWRRKA